MGRSGKIRSADKEAAQLRTLMRRVGIRVSSDPQKIYDAAINTLHNEERAYAQIARHGGKFRRRFTRLVEKYSTFRYPGIFNDYDRTTKNDNRTLLRIHGTNQRIYENVRRRFAHRGWRIRRREYLKELVLDMMIKTEKGRVLYSSLEKTALETARGAKSDCTELTRYAFARLKLAGFEPKLVFVEHDAKSTMRVGTTSIPFHIMVAVQDPTSSREYVYIDLYADGLVGEPDQKRFVAPSTLMSIYHQNKGIYFEELQERLTKFIRSNNKSFGSTMWERAALGLASFLKEASGALALEHHSRAIQYNSMYAPALYSKAYLLWSNSKNPREVSALAAQALRLMPSYSDAKKLLAVVSNE